MGSPAKWYEYQGILGADSGVKSKGAFVLNQNDTTTKAVTITQLNDSTSGLTHYSDTTSGLNSKIATTYIVKQLIAGGGLQGAAIPSTSPGSHLQGKYWFASTVGTYANFGGIVLASNEYAALIDNGTSYDKVDIPTNLTPVLDSIYKLDTAYNNANNIYWFSSNPITYTASGNNINVTVPSGFIVSGSYSSSFIACPSYSGTINHLNALILDMSNPSSPTFINASPINANVKANAARKIFIGCAYGLPWSTISSVQGQFTPTSITNGMNALGLTLKVYVPATNQTVTINNISGNTVQLTIPNGFVVSTGYPQSFTAITAHTDTLNNTQVLYLDVSNPSTPVWTKVSSAGNGIARILNYYGQLFSESGSLNTLLYNAYVVYNSPSTPSIQHYLIRKPANGGIISVNCFDTSITTAQNRITNVTATKRVELDLAPGLYLEPGDGGNGLVCHDFIDIHGLQRDSCIIMGPPLSHGSQANGSAMFVANSNISNLTILGYKNKYCVHLDNAGGSNPVDNNRVAYFDHVNFRHLGSDDGFGFDLGFGEYFSQKYVFTDCNLLGWGMFWHNAQSGGTSRQSGSALLLKFKGCKMKQAFFTDFASYNNDSIVFEGCQIDSITLDAQTGTYNSNPTDTNCNRGWYPPFTKIYDDGANKIGWVGYRDTAAALFGNHPAKFVSLNEQDYNSTSSTIPQGYAVVKGADSALADVYPSNIIYWGNVSPYTGSGVLAGVAEENISAYSSGSVQYRGKPLMYFNNSAGSISYNSPLTVNSIGQFIFWTGTGQIFGYALQPASSNGLIRGQLINTTRL